MKHICTWYLFSHEVFQVILFKTRKLLSLNKIDSRTNSYKRLCYLMIVQLATLVWAERSWQLNKCLRLKLDALWHMRDESHQVCEVLCLITLDCLLATIIVPSWEFNHWHINLRRNSMLLGLSDMSSVYSWSFLPTPSWVPHCPTLCLPPQGSRAGLDKAAGAGAGRAERPPQQGDAEHAVRLQQGPGSAERQDLRPADPVSTSCFQSRGHRGGAATKSHSSPLNKFQTAFFLFNVNDATFCATAQATSHGSALLFSFPLGRKHVSLISPSLFPIFLSTPLSSSIASSVCSRAVKYEYPLFCVTPRGRNTQQKQTPLVSHGWLGLAPSINSSPRRSTLFCSG